jgi:hypothetical protein
VCVANARTVKVCVEALPVDRGAEAGVGSRPVRVFRVSLRPEDVGFEALLAHALAVNHVSVTNAEDGSAPERMRRHLEVSSALVGRTNAAFFLTRGTQESLRGELERLDARRLELIALLGDGELRPFGKRTPRGRALTTGRSSLAAGSVGQPEAGLLGDLVRAASDAAEGRGCDRRNKRTRTPE